MSKASEPPQKAKAKFAYLKSASSFGPLQKFFISFRTKIFGCGWVGGPKWPFLGLSFLKGSYEGSLSPNPPLSHLVLACASISFGKVVAAPPSQSDSPLSHPQSQWMHEARDTKVSLQWEYSRGNGGRLCA